MSITPVEKKRTPADLRARKGGVPIVCLTAHSTPQARLLDPHSDLLLVGDSLGMVVYGFSSTLPVTLDMMIAHGAAVVRGANRACVIVDMPFGAYQESPAQAFRNAARIIAETGCAGVKLEGGEIMAETIRFLAERGVPVLAHVGLQPQSVNALGGFHAQGRTEADAARVIADGKAVAEAGAFAMVVEGTAEPVARRLTELVPVPDDRHRRLAGLRRPDPRDRGHLGDFRRLPAALRQALCRARRRDLGGGFGLCRGRSGAPLPRARAHLRRTRRRKTQGAVVRRH